jgi:uncharacterized YigZ family protein
MPSYAVPARQATAEIREQGSRFHAVIGAASGEDEARAMLASLARRHPGATHLCWALRLGWPPYERSSDAGEPPGTAGIPILHALRGAGLSDVMAVVVRWFGGVKLGKGGLARAYGAAARAALAGLPTARRVARVRLTLAVPLTRLGAVKRLIRPPEVEIVSELYAGAPPAGAAAEPAAGTAEIVLLVDEDRRADIEASLASLRVAILVRRPGLV